MYNLKDPNDFREFLGVKKCQSSSRNNQSLTKGPGSQNNSLMRERHREDTENVMFNKL